MKKFKLKEALSVGIPTATLAVSSANFITNSKKRQENKEYQEKQLEVLNKLTKSIDKVDSTLDSEKKKKKGIKFFQKLNSNILDMAGKGAVLGGGIASGSNVFLPKKIGGHFEREYWKDNGKDKHKDVFIDDPKFKYPKLKEKYNGLEDSGLREILISLGGVAIGATLGAIVGAIKDVSEAVSRKTTVNVRLMKDVLGNLRKSGYTEGKDYTRDPKMANLLKTKVCLVISKSSDSLRLLINTVNDPKLKSLSGGIIKNLPSMSTVTEKASDRFNELNITTMTTNKGDATWVSSVAERFISEGFPVYLVEVG